MYVDYLMPVSSEYIKSRVLLSLTSNADRTSCILLVDVIPWINKANLALKLYSAHHACHDQSEVRKLHCAIEFMS